MNRPDVVVIACGARKQAAPCPAKDLYVGSLFRLARQAAEADGRRWLILSAKHGLVDPSTTLEPYDATITTRADLARLANLVATQPDPGPVEAWLPARYTAALRLAGVVVGSAPFEALAPSGLGYQARWLRRHRDGLRA